MSSVSLLLRRGPRKADAAWIALGVIPLALVVTSPEQFYATITFVARNLASTGPFLVTSVLIAAYAKASGAESLIARAFQGHPAVMVFTAALVGAASPFCSCGVIPLIAALLSMSVPLAP